MKGIYVPIALVFMLLLGACKDEKVLAIGHRGAMGHEMENTVTSVYKAMALGADMIEIDVFRIKSGEIVVFHDKTLDKLSNAGGPIEDYYAYDLRKVILHGNERIPYLQDVLKVLDDKVRLNIELKGANTTDKVNHIVNYYMKEKNWSLDKFIISSFNWDELRAMRKKNPDISIAVLTGKDPIEALEVAQELNAVAINPNYKTLTAENVAQMQQAGLKVYTWTVNEPEDIQKMKEFGVDGIISDFPERVNP